MTEPTPSSTTPTVISEADQTKIRKAMNHAPFSASSRVPIPAYWPATGKAEPLTPDGIIAFIHGLSEVVNEQTEQAQAERRRLHALEADVEALRRVFGTASAEVTP